MDHRDVVATDPYQVRVPGHVQQDSVDRPCGETRLAVRKKGTTAHVFGATVERLPANASR